MFFGVKELSRGISKVQISYELKAQTEELFEPFVLVLLPAGVKYPDKIGYFSTTIFLTQKVMLPETCRLVAKLGTSSWQIRHV